MRMAWFIHHLDNVAKLDDVRVIELSQDVHFSHHRLQLCRALSVAAREHLDREP